MLKNLLRRIRWHVGKVLWNLVEPHCDTWLPPYVDQDDFSNEIRDLRHEISSVEDDVSEVQGEVASVRSSLEDLEEEVEDLH